jgi:hypothetical protein
VSRLLRSFDNGSIFGLQAEMNEEPNDKPRNNAQVRSGRARGRSMKNLIIEPKTKEDLRKFVKL